MVKYCQNEGVNSFFVIGVDMTKVNSYEIDMLYNNFVEGIIQPEFRSIDGEMLLYNKINGLMNLKEYMLANMLTAAQVVMIMKSVCDVVVEAEEYMLNPDELLIKSDYIFCSIGVEQVRFVYAPGNTDNVKKQIRQLIEEIIKKIDHRNSRLVDFMYKAYELVLVDNFDIELLRKYVFDIQAASTGYEYDNENEAYGFTGEKRDHENGCNYNRCNGNGYNENGCNENRYYEQKVMENEALKDMLFGERDSARKIKRNHCREAKMERGRDDLEHLNSTTKDNGSPQKKTDRTKILKLLLAVTILAGLGMMIFQMAENGGVVDVRLLMMTVAVAAVEMFLYLEYKRKNITDTSKVCIAEDLWENVASETAAERIAPHEREILPCEVKTQINGTNVLKNIENATTLLVGEEDDESDPELLVRLVGNESEEKYEVRLSKKEVVIGRDSFSDVVLNDRNISRKHAVLSEKKGRTYIKDLGSTNGTFVNEIRLCRDKCWPLTDGDMLRIGDRDYTIQISLI